MAGIKSYIAVICLVISTATNAQITAGKIVFERKTNLEKKFDDSRMKDWLKDAGKTKVDMFELYFNDTCSVFKPVISDVADPTSWATNKNSVYQNFNANTKLFILGIWGTEIIVVDSNANRPWKVTENKRRIGNYMCRKAIWQKNDSTRIYAWFSDDIIPSVGPEGFNGLPGAILGLATEDGGIIYFAKSVEVMEPKREVLIADVKRKKVFTMPELKEKIEKEYGSTPWGKRMFDDLFRWL
jgi:GLPGLI family protein